MINFTFIIIILKLYRIGNSGKKGSVGRLPTETSAGANERAGKEKRQKKRINAALRIRPRSWDIVA